MTLSMTLSVFIGFRANLHALSKKNTILLPFLNASTSVEKLMKTERVMERVIRGS